jgi:hypothetical protein
MPRRLIDILTDLFPERDREVLRLLIATGKVAINGLGLTSPLQLIDLRPGMVVRLAGEGEWIAALSWQPRPV